MNRVRVVRLSFLLVPVLLGGLLAGPALSATTTVYSNDFQAAVGPGWSPGVLTIATAPLPADGSRRFLGCHQLLGLGPHFLPQFNCPAVSLTLTGLPSHSQLTLSLDLYVIQSWDGNNAIFGPDVFDISVASGPTLLHTTFSNVPGLNQAYPGAFPGNANLPRTGATESNTLGYGFFGDTVYHLAFTFAHTAGSVTFNFSGIGLQPIFDESWGLDNVIVQIPNRPPDCSSVTATPGTLWPANHSLQPVTVAGASDPDGDTVTHVVTGVTQDEPLDAEGDGDTAPDAALTGAPESALLRAERQGSADGRVYRVSYTATDGTSGCSGTVLVTVPMSQKGLAAVDSGPIVDSLGP